MDEMESRPQDGLPRLAQSSGSSDYGPEANHDGLESIKESVAEEDVAAAPNTPTPAQQSSPEDSRTTWQTFIIILSLCAALFLAALDITIVTSALPTIAEYFQSSAGYMWIGSSYLLTNAVFTPSWGKISDIWGRKPILLLAAAIFFVGSTLAATSVNITMLIAARAIQGFGGGGIVVLVNICVSDLFSMRTRGKYLGILAIVWAFAAGVGPVLGGVFTQRVSWRWCFYINLPITGAVFVALCAFLHLDNPRTPMWDGLKALDWTGMLSIVGGTLMLLLGVHFGGVTFPWSSATVICLIVVGALVIVLFVANEWKFARYPIMPIRLFHNRSSTAAVALCFAHGFSLMSPSYYLPLYFQAVLGASPLLSGVYLLPYALSFSITSYATGIFIKRTGMFLPTLWLGVVVTTLGFGLFIDLPFSRSWAKIILYQMVAGFGVGQNLNSPLVALQSMTNPRDIATATALFFFARVLSNSISLVIGGVVFQNEMQKRYPSLVGSLGKEIADALSGERAAASVGLLEDLPPAQRETARMAFYQSLRVMWIMYIAFPVVGLFIPLFIRYQALSTKHTVTKTGLVEEEKKREDMEREHNERRANKSGTDEQV